jgi:hypothetical protein
MLASLAWMKSVAHCSYTTIATWMNDLLGVPVSRGYLSKLCNGVISDSIADVYDEIKEAVPHQKQLGSDETGFKNNGKKHWVWAICSKDLTHSSRQVTRWAKQLLKQTKRLFRSWHARDEMSKATFDWAMRGHRNDFMKLMLKPPALADAENLAARFSVVHYEDDNGNLQSYDQSENYFRFMSAPDVLEPTNNHCDQQIRHCVIDRRITQGTRSDVGQRYNERTWSVVATCAKQGRRIFNFLQESISAHLANKPTPALLR